MMKDVLEDSKVLLRYGGWEEVKSGCWKSKARLEGQPGRSVGLPTRDLHEGKFRGLVELNETERNIKQVIQMSAVD